LSFGPAVSRKVASKELSYIDLWSGTRVYPGKASTVYICTVYTRREVGAESFDRFVEGQDFSRSYDRLLAIPSPLPHQEARPAPQEDWERETT
jgi:hypothetical protein